MKAAWIAVTPAVAGPNRDKARDQALARLEVIADTFLSMNAPVQWALPAWLAGRAAIQQQIRHRVTANLAVLDQAIRTVDAVERLAVEGGWYAVLRIPALNPDDHTVLALLERGVWVHPGYFFGLPESGWLVVSLLAPAAEFSNGVAILINYLGTNHGRNNPGR
jgi:aspartate/methionine/tyrosine aminotransferase